MTHRSITITCWCLDVSDEGLRGHMCTPVKVMWSQCNMNKVMNLKFNSSIMCKPMSGWLLGRQRGHEPDIVHTLNTWFDRTVSSSMLVDTLYLRLNCHGPQCDQCVISYYEPAVEPTRLVLSQCAKFTMWWCAFQECFHWRVAMPSPNALWSARAVVVW